VWIGVDADTVNPSVAATWDDDEVDVGGDGGADSGVLTVFPRGDGLDAAMATTRGDERLLYSIMPFSSRSGLPDWFVWGGEVATGFYAPDWSAD
jgi:hypothetical protein